MLQRRWILLGLVALLFVAKRAAEHRSTQTPTADGKMGSVARAVTLESQARESSRRTVESAQTPTAVLRGAVVDLAAESAATTAEVVQLQQLAQDSGLELNSREWLAFAAVTREIQAVRQAYEASIATATLAGQGKYRVDVPMYGPVGDALRSKFQAALRSELGDANTDAILANMGRRLEGYFGGFGISVQTIDIAGAVSNDPDCVVTRTVRFWNSVDGTEQLATRRETYFPKAEDPSGEMWQPFLELTTQVGG